MGVGVMDRDGPEMAARLEAVVNNRLKSALGSMDDLQLKLFYDSATELEKEAIMAQLNADYVRLSAEESAKLAVEQLEVKFENGQMRLSKRYRFWTAVQYGAVALGVLILLIGAYEMRKQVPKQPHSGSAVVHTADDLEIGRHKHDGSQPTADHARPGQHRTVTWDARL
jgi:hypothetical protein